MADTFEVDGLPVHSAEADATRLKLLHMLQIMRDALKKSADYTTQLYNHVVTIGATLQAKRLPNLVMVDDCFELIDLLAAGVPPTLTDLTRVITNIGGIVATRVANQRTPIPTNRSPDDEQGKRREGEAPKG